MDEPTFQHVLSQLQHRARELANTAPSPPSPASAAQLSALTMAKEANNDSFTEQLRDVKAHLDSMQAKALTQWQAPQSRSPSSSVTVSNPWSPGVPPSPASSADLELAVEALLARKLESVFERIGRMERSVEGLESSVRESAVFTPTASETTVEDLAAAKEGLECGEPRSGAPSAMGGVEQQTCYATPMNLSQVLMEDEQSHGVGREASAKSEKDDAVRPASLSELLEEACLHETSEAEQAARTEDAYAESTAEPELYYAKQNDDDHDESAEQKVYARDMEISRLTDIIRRLNDDAAATKADHDAEISRRETNRAAALREIYDQSEHIHKLETALWERNSTIDRWRNSSQAAQEGLHTMARRNDELRAAYEKTLRELKESAASRHHFMTKYVDENYRFKWLEQRKLQSEQYLQRQLEGYERALDDSERDREAEIRRALEGRDDELDKLHAFCREKDAVVHQQEEIIARGGAILQERDAEIDRLEQEVEEVLRGRRFVRDHISKLRGKLKDRDEEIEDLKEEVRDEKDRRWRLEELMRKDVDVAKPKAKGIASGAIDKQQAVSFARATEEAVSGRGRPAQSSWTPKPIRPGRMLPHEESRRMLWETGASPYFEHQFGSASPVVQQQKRRPSSRETVEPVNGHSSCDKHGSPHGQSSRHVQKRSSAPAVSFASQHVHADNIDAGNDISAHATSQGAECRAAQAAANYGPAGEKKRRHELPLDVTRWPPLPAHAAAAVERVGSLPDLRARTQPSGARGAMSKPASMLNLASQDTRRPYQAPSVETEAESADEGQGGINPFPA